MIANLTPAQQEIVKMQAEITALRDRVRDLHRKLDMEKSKSDSLSKEVSCFNGIISNMSMTPAQKVGFYGLYLAEKEERERLERCIVPECEKNVCQSDKANFIYAKKSGLVHIAIGRICNVAKISRHSVTDMLSLLFINGYIKKKTIKYWREENGGDSVREAMYIKLLDISPGCIKFELRLKLKKKKSDIGSMKVPSKCSGCGSEDLMVEARVTCRDCGSIRAYTGESIIF